MILPMQWLLEIIYPKIFPFIQGPEVSLWYVWIGILAGLMMLQVRRFCIWCPVLPDFGVPIPLYF